MNGRRAVLLLTICCAFLAAAQDEETLTPLPLDEEPVPRGAAITRGVRLRSPCSRTLARLGTSSNRRPHSSVFTVQNVLRLSEGFGLRPC